MSQNNFRSLWRKSELSSLISMNIYILVFINPYKVYNLPLHSNVLNFVPNNLKCEESTQGATRFHFDSS